MMTPRHNHSEIYFLLSDASQWDGLKGMENLFQKLLQKTYFKIGFYLYKHEAKMG